MQPQLAIAPSESALSLGTAPVKHVRVVLADDHALVREGLRALLEKVGGVEIVGEAADGKEAVDLVVGLHPDVVLMDISMASLNGIEATMRITKDHPRTRVLILSMHASPEYARRAIQAGATGYVVKDAKLTELSDAMRAVARGETYISPVVAAREATTARGAGKSDDNPLARLTPRQKEILQLIAEGVPTREIATQLGLSIKTVETHRAQVMERLAIHNVPGLVRFAIRAGLVSSDR